MPSKRNIIDLADHEYAQLINELRDVAKTFGHTQQLRARLEEVVGKRVKKPPATVDLKSYLSQEEKNHLERRQASDPRVATPMEVAALKLWYDKEREPLPGVRSWVMLDRHLFVRLPAYREDIEHAMKICEYLSRVEYESYWSVFYEIEQDGAKRNDGFHVGKEHWDAIKDLLKAWLEHRMLPRPA